MSDELVLPGIDDVASAAPEATPSDEPAAPPASAEKPLGTATEPDKTQPDAAAGGDEPPKVAKGVQVRINELRDRERQALERAAQAEARNDRFMEAVLRGQIAQPQPQARTDAPPRKEDFATWEAYDQARIEYVADQRVRAALGQQGAAAQRQQREYQQNAVAQAVQQGLQHVRAGLAEEGAKAAPKYADWGDVMDNTSVEVPPHLQVAIALSGAPGDVGYYLAKNEHLIPRLAQLPELQLGVTMARIAAATRAGAVSNAPPPGRPAGTRGSNAGGYSENFTPEQHLAWEKRQGAK